MCIPGSYWHMAHAYVPLWFLRPCYSAQHKRETYRTNHAQKCSSYKIFYASVQEELMRKKNVFSRKTSTSGKLAYKLKDWGDACHIYELEIIPKMT